MVQCGEKSGLQEKLRIKHPPAESSAAYFRRKRKTEVLGQKIYNATSARWIPLRRAASSLPSQLKAQLICCLSVHWSGFSGLFFAELTSVVIAAFSFRFYFLAHWRQTSQNFFPLKPQHDPNCIHLCLNPLGHKHPAKIGTVMSKTFILTLYLCMKR